MRANVMRVIIRCLAVGSVGLMIGAPINAHAQAWFGQPLPGPVNDPSKPVVKNLETDLPHQGLNFPPGQLAPTLAGNRIKQDLRTIVGFSLQSRADGNFLWGRVSGTKAYLDTAKWAVAELKAAGLKDAHLEA